MTVKLMSATEKDNIHLVNRVGSLEWEVTTVSFLTQETTEVDRKLE